MQKHSLNYSEKSKVYKMETYLKENVRKASQIFSNRYSRS